MSDSEIQSECEHELVFDVYLEPWFIHHCKKCNKRLFSNRVEGDVKEDE
ncbi:hypothetical protein [uncultured Mediterranean phage uvMED]|nr:hypothetical protein [uncultured Mediterranean phage uvMED]